MAILSTDIHIRLSTTAGAAGNTTAAGAAGTSLGKYVSTTDVVDATLNNVFPDITGDENAASNLDYQCVFAYNAHGTLTLQNAVVWVSADVAGGANVGLGLDTTAASAVGSATAQALTIGAKNTAPAGVTFTSYISGTGIDTKARGLSIGNLAPGQVKGIWIRRSATNSAALNNDGFTIRVEGDTAA